MLSPARILIPAVLGLALASCSDSLAVKVKEVQDKTVEICSYLPTAQSVVDIIKAGGPSTAVPFALATAICDAVVAWKMGDSATDMQGIAKPCPRVNGVCVEGTFVEKDKGD